MEKQLLAQAELRRLLDLHHEANVGAFSDGMLWERQKYLTGVEYIPEQNLIQLEFTAEEDM